MWGGDLVGILTTDRTGLPVESAFGRRGADSDDFQTLGFRSTGAEGKRQSKRACLARVLYLSMETALPTLMLHQRSRPCRLPGSCSFPLTIVFPAYPFCMRAPMAESTAFCRWDCRHIHLCYGAGALERVISVENRA